MGQAEEHRDLMMAAIEQDAQAQSALLGGDREAARSAFTAAAELYRRSWEAAPPGAYGRLVGMLKSAVLAGGGREEAAYAREALASDPARSPTASYVQAIAALVLDEDDRAREWATGMSPGSDAFARTADAITALADRGRDAFTASVRRIVEDFEARDQHLTGVRIADTALMLERLAERRGMPAAVKSTLLPSTT